MSACRIDFDETECLCFNIKEKKVFDNYTEIWENVNNMIKKNLIVNLYIIKNNGQKNIQHKRKLSMFLLKSNASVSDIDLFSL